MLQYVVFETKWGYFGLVGDNDGLIKSCLPVNDPKIAKTNLMVGMPPARFDIHAFESTQTKVKAYFDDKNVDFSDVSANIERFTEFARLILSACRKIGYSQTASYAQLAEVISRPKATRAVGTVMANNPMPPDNQKRWPARRIHEIRPSRKTTKTKTPESRTSPNFLLQKRLLELCGYAVFVFLVAGL